MGGLHIERAFLMGGLHIERAFLMGGLHIEKALSMCSPPIRTTCAWWPGTLAMAYNGDQLSRPEIVQDSRVQ